MCRRDSSVSNVVVLCYLSKVATERSFVHIGCANGGMLRQLKELGFNNLCGIDLAPACVANTQLLGIEAYIGSLSDVPKGLGRFDFIILSHVLEHIQDLRLSVQSLSALVRLGGGIYIEVPDATLYADYIFSPFQDFNTEHINHFSNQSMSNLMRSVGFHLKESGRRLIESSPDMPYPVIYSLWINNTREAIPHSDAFERDNLLEESIRTYISMSKTIMNGIEVKLQSLLAKSPEVIVWGTGQLAMKLLAETSLANANIIAFTDGNPINHGKVIRGIPISSPEQIIGMIQPIIVTSILHQRAISDFIRNKMKLSNEIICLYPW